MYIHLRNDVAALFCEGGFSPTAHPLQRASNDQDTDFPFGYGKGELS